MTTDIRIVGVLGAGQMGGGIAQVVAQSGRKVLLADMDKPHAEAGKAKIAKILGRSVEKGKMSSEERDAVLERLAAGEAILAAAHPESPFVADAHVADLLLLPRNGELHAVPREGLQLEAQPSNDGSQRLFRVEAKTSPETCIAEATKRWKFPKPEGGEDVQVTYPFVLAPG